MKSITVSIKKIGDVPIFVLFFIAIIFGKIHKNGNRQIDDPSSIPSVKENAKYHINECTESSIRKKWFIIH